MDNLCANETPYAITNDWATAARRRLGGAGVRPVSCGVASQQ